MSKISVSTWKRKLVISVSLKYLNESAPSILFPVDSLSSSGAVMSEGGSSWCSAQGAVAVINGSGGFSEA